jgi:hypothetical protein
MSLVRPSNALLMSVPGYRDALRGSGIRPFSDLERLRIRLSGVEPAGLALAGVHTAGERALQSVAERVAAMRDRQLIWRGGADLRATSWVDGSGVDRGLALHAGAFLIAARTELPDMLGVQVPGQKVLDLSQMRERVVLLVTIEDTGRYMPGLKTCAPQALRVSIAADGGEFRMALSAHYAAPVSASDTRNCLHSLDGSRSELSSLMQWLAQAQSTPGSDTTHLRTEVSHADVEQLLEALAWALRSA